MSVIDLLPHLKDKYVELTIGSEFEDIVFTDHVQKVNGAIYGKIQDIIGEFIVVNCFSINKQGGIQSGNILYINSWNIDTIAELKNNDSSLHNVLLSTTHARKIKQLLGLTND